MSLFDTFLVEPTSGNVWLAIRSDQILGTGSASDPYGAGLRFGTTIPIKLTSLGVEGFADTGSRPHGFFEGDMVQISGVTGG